jgi:hypothetical protein
MRVSHPSFNKWRGGTATNPPSAPAEGARRASAAGEDWRSGAPLPIIRGLF